MKTGPKTTDDDRRDIVTGSVAKESYDGSEVDDSEEGYRPFFWYNRDYNIPDECRFYE